MTPIALAFRNGAVFDGIRLIRDHLVKIDEGRVSAVVPDTESEAGAQEVDLGGDILSLGYVDLQVNGGGGVLFNDDPSVPTLRRIAEAHRALGVTALLPTLITDRPERTRAAIAAATEAACTVPGIAGLHLEGPHLSVARKGAHDGGLIRPMESSDLKQLLDAAKALPALMVTVAPENVSEEQVATLAAAGVRVSLGHSDADFDTCRRYMAAGAHCVTHLFNAMSQLGNREPGLVGAAIGSAEVSAGLIADGLHVHPETMRAAWIAKRRPGRLFLVSDAMAVAGTEDMSFDLGGRRVVRQGGALRLSDGTLAGADLDIITALRVIVDRVGIDLAEALSAATRLPAEIIGRKRPFVGQPATDLIRIRSDLSGQSPALP